MVKSDYQITVPFLESEIQVPAIFVFWSQIVIVAIEVNSVT